MRNPNERNILVLNQEGHEKPVAVVDATGKVMPIDIPGAPANVMDMNRKVAKLLVNDYFDSSKLHPSIKIESGGIRTYTASVMRWRGCTALIVLQVSIGECAS